MQQQHLAYAGTSFARKRNALFEQCYALCNVGLWVNRVQSGCVCLAGLACRVFCYFKNVAPSAGRSSVSTWSRARVSALAVHACVRACVCATTIERRALDRVHSRIDVLCACSVWRTRTHCSEFDKRPALSLSLPPIRCACTQYAHHVICASLCDCVAAPVKTATFSVVHSI